MDNYCTVNKIILFWQYQHFRILSHLGLLSFGEQLPEFRLCPLLSYEGQGQLNDYFQMIRLSVNYRNVKNFPSRNSRTPNSYVQFRFEDYSVFVYYLIFLLAHYCYINHVSTKSVHFRIWKLVRIKLHLE